MTPHVGAAIEQLFNLSFVKTGHNTVLVGLNGVGKAMILKNIALQALARGHTVRFTTASDMLAELTAQDSSSILARRIRRYTFRTSSVSTRSAISLTPSLR
jgi:DNA replication protein DnaC